MDCISTRIPYRQTNSFSKIVLDYLDQSSALQPFYVHQPTAEGIRNAVAARKQTAIDREVLVSQLKNQYHSVSPDNAVVKNIDALLSGNTFTITTAHQPNIFTGPLYFLYKILHAIKLAEQLTGLLTEYSFVPVYYMGSEDADLDELGHTYIEGQKLTWDTIQNGAVGRMKVDAGLVKLIDDIERCLPAGDSGQEVISLFRRFYCEGNLIQESTFRLINALFGRYGLIVLIPDSSLLKRKMRSVFEDDIFNRMPSAIVEKTSQKLDKIYKVQAHPREINLFYLKDSIRERIEEKEGKFFVLNTGIVFSKEELKKELNDYPERFSPNVILRGLFQSTILPDVAFIGGGGELAYWLQLKDLFNHYKVPYPVLILRNSFLIVENKWREKIEKIGFNIEDFFGEEQDLLNKLVERESKHEIRLNGALTEVEKIYEGFKTQAAEIDVTLVQHVDALKARSMQQLKELEKKMLRAEKRKYTDQERQINLVKEELFPNNNLQERIDNFSSYYAKWGAKFIDALYSHSLGLEQEFVVIREK